ncbi:putative transcription factor TIFY family [Helianthus debilis subsp. tardiflorus]
MSDSPAVEIDFFRLNEEASSKKLSPRKNIQDVISKINPELLKSAFAHNGFVANKLSYASHPHLQPLPVYNQECSRVNTAATATPLTIIYNGVVSVFDVSPNQADNIMKLVDAVNPVSKAAVEPVAVKNENDQTPVIAGGISKDLPLSRKKSLKRFLEKRKERKESISPYASLH